MLVSLGAAGALLVAQRGVTPPDTDEAIWS
jgi:hypothetical protein